MRGVGPYLPKDCNTIIPFTPIRSPASLHPLQLYRLKWVVFPHPLRPPEMHSSVRLPTGFTVLGAEGPFFSVTEYLDLRRCQTDVLQISFGGLSAPFSKNEVVRTGAPLITVAFDHDRMVRLCLQNSGSGFESRSRLTAECILIEIEIYLGEFCRQFARRRDRTGWKIHRSRLFRHAHFRFFHSSRGCHLRRLVLGCRRGTGQGSLIIHPARDSPSRARAWPSPRPASCRRRWR